MAIYLSRKKGGTVATPITPSNSSPAQMTANVAVNPTANGYAIASYEEIDVPSATYRYPIRPDMPTISRVGALVGVEQLHYHSVDPSNSDPDTISEGEIYKADRSGKAVASITDVMPSSTPTSVSMDDVVHIQGSGVIVDAMPPTPTSITPSNNTPANIASGQTYIATANGRAIESYDGLTDTPMNVSVGDFLRIAVAGKAAMLQTITPSNTNPPEIDYLRGYVPTTPGYVVRNYDSVTPSSTPEAVTAGDMVQINGSGVIVDSIPTPTNLVPSNSSPATITSGETYKAMANGKAVSSVTDITPSNSTPVALTANTPVNPTASGYAISSYSSKTPSDSSPASVSSGAIIKASASGYLYASSGLGKVSTGSFTSPSAGSTISITCGFQPKKICLVMYTGTNSMMTISYDVDMDSSRQIVGWRASSSSYGCQQYEFPNTSTNGAISAIITNSFVYRAGSTSAGKTVYYFAIG